MRLQGKTALVTGGGTGIGEGIALAFAREGCRVAIAGRRADKLAAAAKSRDEPPAILTQVVDVADRDSVAALVSWAESQLGRIDILVNSAGTNVRQRHMADLAPDDWDKLMAINATGAYNCCRAVLPAMRRRRDGVIINICSIAGIRANLLGGISYNASKFALTALGLTLALEYKDEGIRVTNIYPGEVATPILDLRPEPVGAEHLARILQPQDVADAAVMVAALPPRAHVPELTIKPTTQAFA